VYRIDVVKYFPKKKRLFKRLVTLHLIKLFYLVLSQKDFRRLAIKAKKQDGYYERNFVWLLEGRIVSILYRTNYLANMFDSINLVKSGVV
jgi:hypothetical protein